MNSPKTLKFQSFRFTNTGNPCPGVVVKCAAFRFPPRGKLHYADLLLLFRMKPASLCFHSGDRGKRLFSEKDVGLEFFDRLKPPIVRLQPEDKGS